MGSAPQPARGKDAAQKLHGSLAGVTISHYRILRELGRGAMAVVYEAEDLKLGRRVAVKILPRELTQNQGALRRFRLEARAASALNHENICTVHEIDDYMGQPFIVMELLDGRSLDILGPMDVTAIIDCALQLTEALEAAHAKGITHRDIKPGNIFLTTRKRVKVLDFGVAKLAHEHAGTTTMMPLDTAQSTLTEAGSSIGTPVYMSPEQVRAEKLDPRTDLYSFGVVLYELLTHRRPHKGDTEAAVINAILEDTPAPPSSLNPDVPAAMDAVVMKALEKDRDLRYQSAVEMRSDLKRVRRDMSPARPASRGIDYPSATKAAGSPRLMFVGGLAAGALLAGIGFAAFERITSSTPASRPPVQAAAPVAVAPPPVASNRAELLAQAEPLLKAGNPEGLNQVELFLRSHPEDSVVRLRYAMALASLKRFDDARRQCDFLLRQDSENTAAQVAIAKITSWNGDRPGALKLYNAILAKDPQNYDARVGKAFTLMWLDRNDEARKLFEGAARQAPDDTDVAAALRSLRTPR